ncbi:hypothetical protein [uncultured Mailhella sp.]|uniref:hypothetical protein n=1 Tax=uncultured Mailhella sp. TaxID=1981031 RepID=UPI0025F625DD|nr:hypothetical protein [uncultured Mailhella sp.]
MSALHHVDLHLEQKQYTSQGAARAEERSTAAKGGGIAPENASFPHHAVRHEKMRDPIRRLHPKKGQGYLEKGGDSIVDERPASDFLTSSHGNHLS